MATGSEGDILSGEVERVWGAIADMTSVDMMKVDEWYRMSESKKRTEDVLFYLTETLKLRSEETWRRGGGSYRYVDGRL